MALDLSGFDDFSLSGLAVKSVSAPDGKPMLLSLDKIQEDPTQPRTVFDADALAELAASIKAKGVKVPISVKGPDDQGIYTLNHGARRYRASIMAGKSEIPAFIDHEHDDFDQAAENIQRDDLTPLEICLFIERKVGEGFSAKEIAVNIGKSDTFVSKHRSLSGMPPKLKAVYDAGACRDVNTLYELTKAAKKHCEEVEAFVGHGDLTRDAVSAFLADVGKPRTEESSNDVLHVRDLYTVDFVEGNSDAEQKPSHVDSELQDIPPVESDKSERTENVAKSDDGDKLKSPIIIIKHDARPGRLLYKKRPTEVGFVWIKYDDDGQEIEVFATNLELDSVIDG